MAIQKSMLANIGGVTHANAYTQIAEIRITTLNTQHHVQIAWESYANAAARSKGNDAARQMQIMGGTYMVPADDIATYFADSVLLPADKSLWGQAYTWLKTQNDVGLDIDWTTGTTDV